MSGLVRDARGRKHKRGCRSWAAPHDSTDIAQPPEPVVMQRENERSRVVVDCRHIDDNTRGAPWSSSMNAPANGASTPHGSASLACGRRKWRRSIKMTQAILDNVQ